jgi:hypothetical protein
MRKVSVHAKTISFICIFGFNAVSQTLVSGWLASKDLKAFSVFALITGLGNILAFLDFGAGAMVQTNYIRYLATRRLGDIFFVKLAIKQAIALTILIASSAMILLIVSGNYIITLVAVYVAFLGLTITTNTANNLIYAHGEPEFALLLSRSSWFWTLLLIIVFKDYFEKNLYQVSIIAVVFQFISGLVAVVYCKVKKILGEFDQISIISDIEMLKLKLEYKSLALVTGIAGIPLMLSLHADRYIVSYVNGAESIISIAAYGSLFSGTAAIITFLFYKFRASTDLNSKVEIQQKSLVFLKISIVVGIVHLIFGQLAVYFLYPSEVSNLQMQTLYTLALISFALSLTYQLRDISMRFQKIVARSVLAQATVNLFLTFVLAHFIGPIAGPLSTVLAVLLVQIPLLHFGVNRTHITF